MNYLQNFKKLDIKTKKMISGFDSGNFKSAFKGRGLEFAEFKEYEAGEDSKHIDWLVSAREQRLLTKKYSVDKSIKVFFVLDVGKDMDFGFEKKKLDTLIEIFFLLGLSSIENYDEVGALIFSENNYKFLDTKKGKAHIFEIYKNILDINGDKLKTKDKKNDFNLQDIKSVTSFLTKIKLKDTLIFILTDKMDLIGDKNLKILSLKNDIIYVNIFDNFENTLDTNTENSGIIGLFGDTKEQIFIDNLDKEKKSEYVDLRKQKIKGFSNYLNTLGIGYLKIDNLMNVYKEFFYYFKK
ncbi:MAG: DUF58 domain-containing protein [Candidatus Gracilibacteria bacterium]|nr:DUF58 domain-containing protein [Candidatus Gracilibacteria bacterium]